MASALRELGYHVSYVGNEQDGDPPRGSSDQTIIDHARTTNQVVVTSNHDMVLLCLEQPQPVIWLDPHGRNFTRDEMVVLVFQERPDGPHLRKQPTLGQIQRDAHTKPFTASTGPSDGNRREQPTPRLIRMTTQPPRQVGRRTLEGDATPIVGRRRDRGR